MINYHWNGSEVFSPPSWCGKFYSFYINCKLFSVRGREERWSETLGKYQSEGTPKTQQGPEENCLVSQSYAAPNTSPDSAWTPAKASDFVSLLPRERVESKVFCFVVCVCVFVCVCLFLRNIADFTDQRAAIVLMVYILNIILNFCKTVTYLVMHF